MVFSSEPAMQNPSNYSLGRFQQRMLRQVSNASRWQTYAFAILIRKGGSNYADMGSASAKVIICAVQNYLQQNVTSIT